MIDLHGFKFKKIEEAQWEMEKDYQGQPLRIFAEEKLLTKLEKEVFIQGRNVAQMPGLAGPVYLMPDAHSGYGAPIGTVFAMDGEEGYVSPGAIGYDINCGMRLIVTNLTVKEILPRIKNLVNLLFDYIPPGVGRRGFLKVNRQELKKLTEEGVSYLVKSKGIGWDEDVSHIEENGKIEGADFSCVSSEAIERGINQLATLGSGNHYLEIQKVEEIFDFSTAAKLGINSVNQVVVMVHCGSRGFGHQVCSDYLRIFEKHLSDFKLQLADKQLACAPISSSYAKNYLSAMACAANFAFVNREAITYQIRKVFERVFGKKAQDLQMKLIYDVAHNIGKFERHFIPKNNGDRSKIFELLVHRKGATRSFPDQPVIIGGSMETGSYLLIGTDKSLEKSYGSTAHGSGRTMSRSAAKKIIRGETLWQKMKEQGIYVKSASYSGLAEEAGLAYKNISDVVKSIEFAGLSKPVAYFKPMGNIKG